MGTAKAYAMPICAEMNSATEKKERALFHALMTAPKATVSEKACAMAPYTIVAKA